MKRNIFGCGALLVCGVLTFAGHSTLADDEKGDKDKPSLSGSWEKKDAEPKLKFTTEGELTIYPHGDNLNIQIECSYTVTKEGLVKAKVKSLGGTEKVVEQVKNVVPVGMEFQFKWKVEGGTATLDEVEGKDADPVKSRLEGDYAKKE
jgi:hypothetical protein